MLAAYPEDLDSELADLQTELEVMKKRYQIEQVRDEIKKYKSRSVGRGSSTAEPSSEAHDDQSAPFTSSPHTAEGLDISITGGSADREVRVKREPSERIPFKPRSAQVIDLTDDSDGDEEEDSEDDEDEEEIELLGGTNVILARHTGKGPIPATRTNGRARDLLTRAEEEDLYRPLQAIDSIAGSIKRPAVDDTSIVDGPNKVLKFWKPRDETATPQSSTASDSTMSMSDESTPSARSISITHTPTPDTVQIKYKGPILTEISTKAIWSHLDNGWKHIKRNKTALRSLASWWAWTPVNKAHKLGKQENWLLAYATFKWWEALEERWRTVLSETGPGSYVQVGMTMKEIRLKKEGREVTAAMQCEGTRKDVNAVYKLYGTLEDVKKVSVEDGDVKGKVTQSDPPPPQLGGILGAISDEHLSVEDMARRYEAKFDSPSKPALKDKIGSH